MGCQRKRKRKREKKDKFEATDDWCFVCKDGGDLMLCDDKNCLKVYHPGCVGQHDPLPTGGKSWICDRHSCFICGRSPKSYCFCCPNAVCGRCDSASLFALVRENAGFCCDCLKLILRIEENEDFDSDGENLDFKSRDTYEGLFKEYWDIIKDKECLTLEDVYSADTLLQKGKSGKHGSNSDEPYSGEDGDEWSYDNGNGVSKKRIRKSRSSAIQEFEGWGSKSLIQFLNSIGEDTSEKISQLDVESIVLKYIREKQLFHLKSKRKFKCDERLYSLFRKKTVNRYSIYRLLEPHFKEYVEISDDDDDDDDDDEIEDSTILSGLDGTSNGFKRQKMSGTREKPKETEAVPDVRESCFASVTAANIKLIYLRKSVVDELLKQSDSFESKIVGSLVKVKRDPRDCLSRNLYKIMKVTGVKKPLTSGDVKGEVLLQVCDMHMPTEVSIAKLSDFDVSEEECEELKEKVEQGLIKKPTVVELCEKAKILHEDITKHWIEKELVRLQNCIEHANEKGWRRELFQYLEQRSLLSKPSEQERLLKQEPKVIPELIVVNPTSANSSENDKGKSNVSPQSVLKGNPLSPATCAEEKQCA